MGSCPEGGMGKPPAGWTLRWRMVSAELPQLPWVASVRCISSTSAGAAAAVEEPRAPGLLRRLQLEEVQGRPLASTSQLQHQGYMPL